MEGDWREKTILRDLLARVETGAELSQRDLARDLGIALGMVNTHVRRCVKKGFIEVSRPQARRYAYRLTHKGSSEKSRLTAELLSSSFQLFRDARSQCLEVLRHCERKGWGGVVLYGRSELSEITRLVARETAIELLCVVAPGNGEQEAGGLRAVPSLDAAPRHDAVLITDIRDPQGAYEALRSQVAEERLLAPPLLHLTKAPAGGGEPKASAERWYVARTKVRAETRAVAHLRRQGFEVYLPQYGRKRRHARRTDVVRAPLFPRYLFLCMDLSNSHWHSVNSTVGVHALVCHGEVPAPVPQGVVEELRAREGGDGLVPLHSLMVLEQGKRLRIVEGPLHDRVGVYEKMTGDERVVLLLRLLGREVRVAVPLSATRSA
jgi:transcriptional antiterminator RfaH